LHKYPYLFFLVVVCALVGSRTPDVGVFVDTLSGDNIFSDLSIIVGYPRAFYGYKWGFQQVLRAFSTYSAFFTTNLKTTIAQIFE
jgi:hypothetical protein